MALLLYFSFTLFRDTGWKRFPGNKTVVAGWTRPDYKVWPFVQAVNFSLVPLQHRDNFVHLVSLCWNMYLSWMSNKPVISETIEYESSDMISSLSSDATQKNCNKQDSTH